MPWGSPLSDQRNEWYIQISMRSLAVEVAQAQSHIMKDGVADILWENAVLLNARGEVRGEKLHD